MASEGAPSATPMDKFTVTIAVLILSLTVILTLWRAKGKGLSQRVYPLPPGPPGLPVIGNLADMPRSSVYAWLTYRDWGFKYGSDIVHVSIFGQHVTVVNSERAAHDLFTKRSSLYADRPVMTAMKWIGLQWPIGIEPYGTTWRLLRRLFHDETKPEALVKYERHRQRAVNDFLRSLVSDPGEFKASVKHMAGRIIMRIAYGIEIRDINDPYIQVAEDALQAANMAQSFNGVILDLIPILKYLPAWFPGANFKAYAHKVRPVVSRTALDLPWEAMLNARREAPDGEEHISAAGNVFDKHGHESTMQDVLKAVPATMYLAGAETSVSTLLFFFMAMALYPGPQRKAQEELDNVLGTALPQLSDHDKLPYVTALVKEVMRWHPAAPLGLPHRLIREDVYEGMCIPEGIVIGNVFAILHDPTRFPSPDVFDPAHFIPTNDGGLYPIPSGEDIATANMPEPDAAFGFGRRTCPGQAMGASTVWLVIASVLSAFDITTAKDDSGSHVPVIESWTNGFVSYPGPYRCAIKPRSDTKLEAVLNRVALDGSSE